MTVGLAFVTGDGDVVRGGGRVVKNVAGFDLVRLTIGAWGTLGVITEATVRLRARPEVDETVALMLPAERDALATLLSTVRAASRRTAGRGAPEPALRRADRTRRRTAPARAARGQRQSAYSTSGRSLGEPRHGGRGA